MSRVKRVRFADLDTVREINRQPDASSSPAKSSLPRSFDNPKTSEYQYYQKLRQAASHKGHSYLRDKQDNHLNDIEASNYMRANRLKSSIREDTGHSVHSCLSHKQESHLRNSEASNRMGVDDPKTSEYQYFMKLQEDTFDSIRSHPPHKQDNPLKKIGASNCTGELCNVVSQNYEVSRSLTPIEKATPIELKSSSLADRASRNSELQFKNGEIFSRKRHKLLKLAAKALSHDVDEFSSNGSDLLSEFLQRLGIESNASNSGCILRSRPMDLDINSTFLANPETFLSVEEVPHAKKMHLMPSTEDIREKGLPECWDAEEDTLIHPLWVSLDANSHSTGHAHETSLPYKSSRYDSEWDGGRTTILHTERNSTFGIDLGTEFSFNRSGCIMLEHMPSESDRLAHKILPSSAYSPEQPLVLRNISSLRELDEIYGPKEPALARERCPLQLLCWADSSLVNEPELSIASHRTGMNLNPMVADHWWSFDSSLDAIAPCSPSLFHKRNPPNSSLQKLLLDWGPSSTIERYILQEGGFPVEESDNFPLILSRTQNYLDLTEGCKLSGNYKERNRNIFVSEASQEKCHPNLDAVLLPSNLNLEFRWKSLSATNFFSENNLLACSHLQFHEKKIEDLSKCMRTCNEFNGHQTHSHSTDDMFNICGLESFSCELPLNQKRARRLLLDGPSWHIDEGDI